MLSLRTAQHTPLRVLLPCTAFAHCALGRLSVVVGEQTQQKEQWRTGRSCSESNLANIGRNHIQRFVLRGAETTVRHSDARALYSAFTIAVAFAALFGY